MLRFLGEPVRRRDFISLLGTVATLYSIRSRAQQRGKTYLIGYLAIAEIPYGMKAFKDGLRKLGYIEGQNLKVEYRIVAAGGASVDTLAAELVELGPDIIIAVGTSATIAAKRATATIPIVMNARCRSAARGYCHEPRASWRQCHRYHALWFGACR